MDFIEIFLIGVGLSMDAFAVSLCKGLSMRIMNYKKAIIIGLYFGIFQAIMPLLGYFLGHSFEKNVININHWIAFIILCLIGGNMIKEVFSKEENKINDSTNFIVMFILAIATSIDALTVGLTFAFLKVNIIFSILLIGIMTFILSFIGVKIGNIYGVKYKKKATLAGGIILIMIGIKILLLHLGIL